MTDKPTEPLSADDFITHILRIWEYEITVRKDFNGAKQDIISLVKERDQQQFELGRASLDNDIETLREALLDIAIHDCGDPLSRSLADCMAARAKSALKATAKDTP